MSFKAGDLIEVRSAAEILATLDERGELENLPFMPEMLKFCGRYGDWAYIWTDESFMSGENAVEKMLVAEQV